MSNNAIRIEPVTPRIGAIIRGVDLTRPLSPLDVESLEQAWARHLVLFFRDQQMSREGLLALASRFGALHCTICRSKRWSAGNAMGPITPLL